MINNWLFKQIDNSPLIVFRMIFGLLIFLESAGAIFTGWVDRTLIAPEFTFNFIGFDFLQPLPGYGMYVYFALMACCGLLVMLGYRYKWSMGAFAVLWAGVYLMQKASYNNHYYLLMLLNVVMFLLPANRYASLDVKRDPSLKRISMPRWCAWLIILQVWIVYTYASVAKWYPDWLDLTVAANLMKTKAHFPVVGDLLQQPWIHAAIAYTGILFDLLVVPLLLCKRTRTFAFILSVCFHLFNSFIFHIGIFPYLSLAFILFFYEPETVRRIFLPRKPAYTAGEVVVPPYRKVMLAVAGVYFVVQIALPLRHWFIPGDVLWTEEGHRLSWRMMLRTKAGYIRFKIVDKETGETFKLNPDTRLSKKQKGIIATKPDVIWQFVQRLKEEYAAQGRSVAIYAYMSGVSVNGGPVAPFIDPDTDLAQEEWYLWKHQPWILPYKKETD
ncbi:HTTM domain-containing protein [Robertkochia sediminum]|uniref:HTTM domain-containing protein n=1 Tax=Robertkochia sediminum TaxID=2785326 RepID=UPI001932AAFF|nr:HTTM domain-containing protein [Robertkochia sediminum]MBL7472337.1 HTTM domain-containing protein [Robertkochia sediminum]